MSEEQRVTWEDRAAYLRVLNDLKRAISREQDAVQVGAAETIAFGYLIAETIAAREVYRCKVMALEHDRQREQRTPKRS